jgi:hypothetical protein
MKSKPEPRADTRRSKKQISTYPADWAWGLLGGGASTVATAAVECWAQVVAQATLDNKKAFTAKEWESLADWLGGRNIHELIPHSARQPGVVVAMMVNDPYEGSSDATQAIGQKLRDMDYAHVWAVLWALDWKQRSGAVGEWWTLAERVEAEK